MRRTIRGSATTTIVALLVIPTLAGRGSGSRHGKGGEDSSELDGSHLSLNDADLHFGETVTVFVKYAAMRETARVRFLCYREQGLGLSERSA